MNKTEDLPLEIDNIEFAAGGLVWKPAPNPQMAVVHRAKHKDWSLPKGRPKANESLDATALREAMEETKHKAYLTHLAGTYSYKKGDQLKIVLVWHMTHQDERYSEPASNSEIDRVVWLQPKDAIKRLTHDAEREFVKNHCLTTRRLPWWSRILPNPRKARLDATIQLMRERFAACINRQVEYSDVWWADSARQSLDLAEAALTSGDLESGWRAVHETDRFLVHGLTDYELITRALSLRAETSEKLTKWRHNATESQWDALKLTELQKAGANLTDDERTRLEQTVSESLTVLNEHNDNTYYRMYLVGRQLKYLVIISIFLLLCTAIGSWLFVESGSQFDLLHLGSIALAGAFGAIAASMYQLSRMGKAKIPEALLHELITLGRPLEGAISALFIYFVIQSDVISFIKQTSFGAGLVLGFIAGFSEQFVLRTIAKVSGEDDKKKPLNVPHSQKD
jgi:8-oxo-dGTP diphosphatase